MELMEIFEQGRIDCTKLSYYFFMTYLNMMDELPYYAKKVLVEDGLEKFKELGLKPQYKECFCDYDHPGDKAYSFNKIIWA